MTVNPTYEQLVQRVKELEQSNSVGEPAHGLLWGSEETFKKIADFVPVQISIIALEGETKYLYVNREWEKIIGYSKDELAIVKPIDIVHPEMKHTVLENAQKRLSGHNAPDRYELKVVTKSGDTRMLDFSAIPVVIEEQKAILTTAVDITEQKRAETQLRESNHRLESFLQVSRRITSTFSKSELMQAIVDNATRAIGLGSGAVYLLSDHDTVYLAATVPPLPDGFPEKFRVAAMDDHPHLAKAAATGRAVLIPDSETAVLTPAEQEILQLRKLRSSLFLPIRFADRPIGVLILSSTTKKHAFTDQEISLLQGFADQAAQIFENIKNFEQAAKHAEELEQEIAERKQAEMEREKLQGQLIQAQKMESVGRLAGGVAHDFNNMLGVILGYTEFALGKVDVNSDVSRDLKKIQKAAKHSAELTRQLLTFARKQVISPRQLELNDTVESMLSMLRRLIGEDIELAWHPGAHLWPVKMDPAQIDQILANLCINARDAVAGVGRLSMETGNQTFDAAYCRRHPGFVAGDFVRLTVSDNGCGMDKTTLAHLFEPFFTTKEVGKGTGLGLATVYGIVKQNNGFINVYSEPGQGATFTIYLPRFFSDEPVPPSEPEKTSHSGGTETILLVEDEPMILEVTTDMLQMLGYSVLAAPAPGEAIRLAQNHAGPIDLLMSDVVMPEMNGRDLAQTVTGIYPGIGLLFMSGYTADVIAHQGVLEDGVAFIQKPFSMAFLAEKVREVLDRV
jgi:PAS domain S-box-containing protein